MVVMSKGKPKPMMMFLGRNYQLPALGLGFIVLIALASMLSSGNKAATTVQEKATIVEERSLETNAQPTPITLGKTRDEVSYYHCSGGGDNGDIATLVLLHGAKFTKQNWKSAGILENFCLRTTNRKLDVFAVDLDKRADYNDLIKFLDDMVEEGKMSKPVSLVTPSASGKTMVSWLEASDTAAEAKLPKYIDRWIPVAAGAVNTATKGSIAKLKELKVPILAIYGDEDSMGRSSSQKLETFSGAHVVELVGSHPCYLDSPKEFVKEVVQFIDIQGTST